VVRALAATGSLRSGAANRAPKTQIVLITIMIQPMVGMLAGSAGFIRPWVRKGRPFRTTEPATPMPNIQPNMRERSW